MRAGPAGRALALEAALAGVGIALWGAGRLLPAPPVTSWAATSRWYTAVGPDLAVASLIRLVALVVAGWLMVATAAQLGAAASASLAARRTADLIAPRSLQRFVHGLAGVSLSAGLAVVAPGAGTPAVVAVSQLVTEPPPGTATLHLIPDAAPPATPAPVAPVAPSVPAPDAPAPDAPAPTVPAAATVVVAPGDSLWSIAEEALAEAGEGEADERAIARYWRSLVEANRSTLVDPGNPDLIYPGHTVVLPTP